MKKITSPAQLAANQANAQNSSGPRTAAGKARSSQNRRKKFPAIDFSVIRLEDPGDLNDHLTGFIESYKPQTHAELSAVTLMAHARHDLDRAYRLKAGILSTSLANLFDAEGFLPVIVHHEALRDAPDLTRAQNDAASVAKGIHRLSQDSDVFQFVFRWASQAERDLRRAEERFFHLRNLRQSLAADPESPFLEDSLNEANPSSQPDEPTEVNPDSDRTQIDPNSPEASFQTGDAEISGIIFDDLGPTAHGAAALMSENQELRCAVTDSHGRYKFPNLPAGEFLLSLINPCHIKTMSNSGFMARYAKKAFDVKLVAGQSVIHPLHRHSSGFTSGGGIRPEVKQQ